MHSFSSYLTEAFTKQHYIAIAKILKDEHEESVSAGERQKVSAIAHRLASMFANDNAAFDKERFLSAAGV